MDMLSVQATRQPKQPSASPLENAAKVLGIGLSAANAYAGLSNAASNAKLAESKVVPGAISTMQAPVPSSTNNQLPGKYNLGVKSPFAQ
jgi:hypothetical protein